jgi:hypothetical protein
VLELTTSAGISADRRLPARDEVTLEPRSLAVLRRL